MQNKLKTITPRRRGTVVRYTSKATRPTEAERTSSIAGEEDGILDGFCALFSCLKELGFGVVKRGVVKRGIAQNLDVSNSISYLGTPISFMGRKDYITTFWSALMIVFFTGECKSRSCFLCGGIH
jgi:hypothetical protein